MEITFIQGLLLSIAAMIFGIDFWLESFFIFRPLIVSTITGMILGDVKLGLTTGALTELAFAGLTPAGGTQPPNPILAGVMCTVIAYSTNVDGQAALGLCLPFSFLMQYVVLFCYSSFSFFMGVCDKAAENGDTKKIAQMNLLMTGIVALLYGVVVFACTFLAQDAMNALVNHMPEFLTHGLTVAGGILPAIGFGMLLNVMMKPKYIPYFIAGFLAVCFIDMKNLLPVALMGTAFALFDFFNAKQRQEEIKEAVKSLKVDGGDEHVGI